MNHQQNVQNNIDANIQKKMMQGKIIETSTVALMANEIRTFYALLTC